MWPYFLLMALACGVYSNALGNGFVSDDHIQLLGNPLVTGWQKIPEIFQHGIWAFTGGAASNYYRPAQTVLYLALYSVFGFDAFAFHLVLVLIHGANTLLVYSLGRRLLKSRDAALVAGIVFAVHPIHSEAVVWIAVFPDVLLTAVVLAALLWFVRWDAAPRRGQIAGLAALFFLALLIKEPGAMLVPLLAGYEYLYLGRPVWPRENWALYASLMGVFGVYVLLRIHALGGMAPAQGIHYKLHGKVLILSIIGTLGQYLAKLIAPVHLNYFYFFEPTTSLTPLTTVSLAVELAMIAAIFLLRSRRGSNAPSISYGLFFILMPLLPALNLNGVGENVFAERYLYLPSAGFVLVVAAVWEWLAARQRETAWALVAIIVAASAWTVLPRNLDWHDDERLLTVSAASSPKAAAPVSDLATLYYRRREYAAAIENYRRALKLQPDRALLHFNLGSAYEREGRHEEAVAELRKAVALDPADAEAHMSLGLELDALGDVAGAIAEDQRALDIRPEYGDACANLAVLRMKEKDYPAAVDLLHRAIAIDPQSFEAHFNLGVAYNYSNRYAEASEALKKAIEVAPMHPGIYLAHFHLGVSYAQMNSTAAAAREFSKALELKPDFAPAQEALAQSQSRLKQQ